MPLRVVGLSIDRGHDASDATMMTRERSGSLGCGVEGTYQSIFHDTGHGHRTPAVSDEVSLDGRRDGVGRQFRRCQRGLRGDLLVARSP
jgi:hypothetical protein